MSDVSDTNPSDHQNNLGLMELYLRFSIIPLTLTSLCVMATDTQASDVYGNMVYKNFSGFKYLISVDAISTCYTLIAIFISCLRKTHFISHWVFFISDQAMAYLMLTSGASVMEVLYLAYKGNRNVTWSEGCSYYGKFCMRAKVSLVLHCIALISFVLLSLISAFRSFSKFDLPHVPSSSEEFVEEN